MAKNRIMLNEAVKFHGHLGPYLMLGILLGEFAIKNLKIKKYFGLNVKVYGANKKPKSCLIDGLQLSTGATFGKGNIHKFNGKVIKVEFNEPSNSKRFIFKLKNELVKRLEALKTHPESEAFAKKIYNTNPSKFFDLTQKSYELGAKS